VLSCRKIRSEPTSDSLSPAIIHHILHCECDEARVLHGTKLMNARALDINI
jgi:hypothetical protein